MLVVGLEARSLALLENSFEGQIVLEGMRQLRGHLGELLDDATWRSASKTEERQPGGERSEA